MSKGQTGKTPGSGALADRWAMWRGLRLAGPQGFVAPPEPRTIGMYSRGKMLLAGQYFHGGGVTERPDLAIWDVNVDVAEFVSAAQGFGWLDDLAAVGDTRARTRA